MNVARISQQMIADGEYTFDTLADALSASPGDNITAFRTLGRVEPYDGGGAGWVYNPATTLASITCANGRKYELSVDIVNVKTFGAMGDGSGASEIGIKSAVDYAKAKVKPVYIPSGVYRINSPIVIDHSNCKIFGDGVDSKLRGVDLTTEVFRYDLGAMGIGDCLMDGLCFEAEYSSSSIVGSAAAVRVVSDSATYFQYNEFANIEVRGFPSWFNVTAPSHVTAFGNEGAVNWCRFDNIKFGSFSRQQIYGYVFNKGSGTGNSFKRHGGRIDESAWLYQADGGTYVVGDISIEDMCQWLSSNTSTSTLLTIGANTNYRARIRLSGGQADAGIARLVNLASGGAAYESLIVDVIRGGGCIVGPRPVGSVISPVIAANTDA